MDEPLSEGEEDYLDMLLGDALNEDDEDTPYVDLPDSNIGDSEASSQSSSASQDPLARPDIYWRDHNDVDHGCVDPRTVPFKPQRKPGLQLGSNITRQTAGSFRKPIDFFYLFMTNQLVFNICIATNHYAEALLAKGQNMSYGNPDGTWTPVTVDEMYRFIGIIIYMSFVQLPTTDRYWSTNPLYKCSTGFISTIMTLKRFKAILSFIQINGDPDKDDKLTRVLPLLNHIQTASQMYFQPYDTISVDERMVASKHKFSGIRQFVKDKPIRFGIKLWVLADTVTGYTYSFFVYLGKKRTLLINKSKGLSYNVVMELAKPLFNQGYRLYTDCFYTSLHLAKDLLQNSTYLIGAIKSNSTAMPLCFRGDVHLFNKFAARGDFRWHRESTFVFVQWKDCRTVTFISPIHKGSSISECMRTVSERSGFKRKRVQQPQVVHDYNNGMGGVDKSNQLLNKYPCYIRSQLHWWKVLFFHCLDIMIVNSYILLQQFCKSEQIEGVTPDFGQLEYRESLASSLLDVKASSTDNELNFKGIHVPDILDIRKDCSFCSASSRMQGLKYLSVKTIYYCSVCKVPLCYTKERNCFQRWHSKEGKMVKEWAQVHGRKRDLNDK